MTESKRKFGKSVGLTLFVMLSVSALMGVLAGALCFCFAEENVSELLETVEKTWFSVRKSGSLAKVLIEAFLQTSIYLIAAYILGYGAISQPVQMLLPFLKGISSGVILTQMYGDSFSKQTLLKVISCMPGIFISLILVILASRESIYMSSRLFKICFRDRLLDGMRERTKLYTARMAIFFAAASVTAALDCSLVMLIYRRF